MLLRSAPHGCWKVLALACGLVVGSGLAGVGLAASASPTSAPIDASLFREGEVQHLTSVVGQWTVLCDEVTRLRRRYCSLRSSIRDPKGANIAWLTVSTDDGGRPTALVELPLGTRLAAGVTVEQPAETCRGKKGRGIGLGPACARKLSVSQCDAARCFAIWALNDGELAAFRAGIPMRLVYQQSRVVSPLPASLSAEPSAVIGGPVVTEGFASAVSASMR